GGPANPPPASPDNAVGVEGRKSLVRYGSEPPRPSASARQTEPARWSPRPPRKPRDGTESRTNLPPSHSLQPPLSDAILTQAQPAASRPAAARNGVTGEAPTGGRAQGPRAGRPPSR